MSNASSYVMDQLAEKETFFINLSKLIELKFIPTIDLNSLLLKTRSPNSMISTCPKSFLVTICHCH